MSTTDAGFVQFLQKHSSPKNQRVTAGGKIVPMTPPTPQLDGKPRLEGVSPVLMVMMDEDPSVVGRVFLGDKVVAGEQTDGPYDQHWDSSSSDEDNLHVYCQTPQSLAPMHPADPWNLDPRIAPRNPHSRITEDVPLQQAPGTSVFVPDPTQRPSIQLGFSSSSLSQFESYSDGRIERWCAWAYEIQEEETMMKGFVLRRRNLDIWVGVDFYRRYVRCAWICGIPDREEAETRLRHKLSLHEQWLVEINGAMALDLCSRPDGRSLHYRIYNTNERARILAALEELDGIRNIQADLDRAGYITFESIASTFGEDFTRPTIQDNTSAPDMSPDAGVTSDGVNDTSFVSHTRATGPIRIIDPHTGCPIDLIGLSQKAKKRDGRANGAGADLSQANGVAHDGIDKMAGIPVPAGSIDLSLDIAQSSEQIVKELTDLSNGAFLVENGQLTLWIPQEILKDLRPLRKRVSSKTVPRNFGRPRYGPGLQTITEVGPEFFSHDDNEAAAVWAVGRAVSSPVITSSGKRGDHDNAETESHDECEMGVFAIIEETARDKIKSVRNDVSTTCDHADEIAHDKDNGAIKPSDNVNGGIQDYEMVMGSIMETSGLQQNRSKSISSQTVIFTDTLSASSVNENELQFDLEDLSDSSCTSEMPLLLNSYHAPHVRPRLAIKPSDPTVLSSLLINLHALHTAPAIALTNNIEVYASFAMN
ncbi:hypothetical protein N7508_003245 [Penicillium antarcticum]|nr:uncharacterized protein N7508_003245 [Penicillium antarcticum]KAJ5312415.1 hypothetical protein N7508_003245 [Penicillium antarcticum]